jgi:hypothetical protein
MPRRSFLRGKPNSSLGSTRLINRNECSVSDTLTVEEYFRYSRKLGKDVYDSSSGLKVEHFV